MRLAVIVCALMLCSIIFAQKPLAQKPIPVIFDTDIGDDIDDALALALALQSPELNVRLVTTVVDDVESRTRLAWKELRLYHREDVKLAMGAAHPLLADQYRDKAMQFRLLTPDDPLPAAARRPAATAIVEEVLQSPEKITLIAVGPLTNVALALRLNAGVARNIERIVLMGGAFSMNTAEYNIRRDPVAAQIVFSSGIPITAVGLDVTMKCTMTQEDLDTMRNATAPQPKFLMQLIQLWQEQNPGHMPTLHDPLAVATAARATMVETQAGAVSVEVRDPLTDGMTIFSRSPNGAGTTLTASHVDPREFMSFFLSRVAQPARNGR